MKKAKSKPYYKDFWIVESEYGWDIKRYLISTHFTEKQAKTLKAHLDAKNPSDKHEVYFVKGKRI